MGNSISLRGVGQLPQMHYLRIAQNHNSHLAATLMAQNSAATQPIITKSLLPLFLRSQASPDNPASASPPLVCLLSPHFHPGRRRSEFVNSPPPSTITKPFYSPTTSRLLFTRSYSISNVAITSKWGFSELLMYFLSYSDYLLTIYLKIVDSNATALHLQPTAAPIHHIQPPTS